MSKWHEWHASVSYTLTTLPEEGWIDINEKTYMVSYKIVLDNGHASARASQQPLTLAGPQHIYDSLNRVTIG